MTGKALQQEDRRTLPLHHHPQPLYLESREAKACWLASGTQVEDSSYQSQQCSRSYHNPHA